MDKKNYNLKRINVWIYYLVLIFFLMLIEFVDLDVFFRKEAEKVLAPAMSFGTNIGYIAKKPFQIFADAYQASVKIQDLEIRYSESLATIGQLKALEEENQALRQIIENTDRKISDSIVTAPIISYGDPYINSGEEEGVSTGDLVMLSQTLLGLVESVSPHQSQVLLLNKMLDKSVLVKTSSGAEGIMVGDGKRIIVKEISKNAPISVGDRVVTLGQEGIERDLFIGKINYIIDSPELATKEAYVEQLTSFYDTRILEVRKK